MAKEITQSLKESSLALTSDKTSINEKFEGIANLKSAASVFSRRTNLVSGVTVDAVKGVDVSDRTFDKEYDDLKDGRRMIERTVIETGIALERVFKKDQSAYIDAAKLFVDRNVSTDFFIYHGQSDNGNPLFELVHLNVNDKMYKRTKDNPNPPKPVSTILKPRINKEDIERFMKDPKAVLPTSLHSLIRGEVVKKRTTRLVKK